jgi:carboxylesterase
VGLSLLKILPGAEPFLLPGSKKGALLIHGFTGSPSEMRLLGEHLHRENYTVLAPRLAGHGTTPEDMACTSWRHWYGSGLDAYPFLAAPSGGNFLVWLFLCGLVAL